MDGKIKITKNQKDVIKKKDLVESYQLFCSENSQRCQPRSSLFNRLEQVGIDLSDEKLHNYDVYRGIQIINNEEDNDKEEIKDILGEHDNPGIYNSEIIYPNNSIVITFEQYEEYMTLKTQMDEVDEDDEFDEVEAVKEVKTTMKIRVKKPEVKKPEVNKNNNIVVNELEDIVIKEDKKLKVNNIMDEDNDNDEPLIKKHFDQNQKKRLHVMIFQILKN
jgi:hypothetical protein